MTQKEMIVKIKEHVANNPAAKDLCLVWAMRQRARWQVTTVGIMQRMSQEHFKHTAKEYNNFLFFLSFIGCGRIVRHGKDKLQLKNIPFTLQSIGAIGSGAEAQLETYKRAKVVRKAPQKVVAKVWRPNAKPIATKNMLNVAYDGELMYIPLPKDADAKQVAALIEKIKTTGIAS